MGRRITFCAWNHDAIREENKINRKKDEFVGKRKEHLRLKFMIKIYSLLNLIPSKRNLHFEKLTYRSERRKKNCRIYNYIVSKCDHTFFLPKIVSSLKYIYKYSCVCFVCKVQKKNSHFVQIKKREKKTIQTNLVNCVWMVMIVVLLDDDLAADMGWNVQNF